MPEVQLTGWQAFHFFLIIIALPLQYYLVEWTGNTSELARSENIESLIKSSRKLFSSYFSINTWKRWMKTLMMNKSKIGKTKVDDSQHGRGGQECVAEEVFYHRQPSGYFAGSPKPRSPRPSSVKYRVGQVIRHKVYGYRGVIVGWDSTCKAPSHWIEQNHRGHPEFRDRPNYSVLVHNKDRAGDESTYVAQDNIEIISNTEIKHSQISDHFDFYDGAQYHMRPALKTVYPYD